MTVSSWVQYTHAGGNMTFGVPPHEGICVATLLPSGVSVDGGGGPAWELEPPARRKAAARSLERIPRGHRGFLRVALCRASGDSVLRRIQAAQGAVCRRRARIGCRLVLDADSILVGSLHLRNRDSMADRVR